MQVPVFELLRPSYESTVEGRSIRAVHQQIEEFAAVRVEALASGVFHHKSGVYGRFRQCEPGGEGVSRSRLHVGDCEQFNRAGSGPVGAAQHKLGFVREGRRRNVADGDLGARPRAFGGEAEPALPCA